MKSLTLEKVLPWLLIVCGSIGVAASAIITVEKIELLQNPSAKFLCDINPIVSCGSVMQSAQASAFGFPNPLIGLVGFPILVTTGVILLQKVRLKRWYWLGMQAGLLFGVIFAHWLFFQATYRINAICPYCVSAWIVTITSFWYVLLYNLHQKHVVLPARIVFIGPWLRRHHLDILLVWLLLIAFFVIKHFWYYFGRNL